MVWRKVAIRWQKFAMLWQNLAIIWRGIVDYVLTTEARGISAMVDDEIRVFCPAVNPASR